MDLLPLAQRDTGSWIETVVILLVIAGSVLGPLAKKLIDAFTPKQTDSQRPGADGPEKVAPARPARPVTPPATPRAQTMAPAAQSASGPPVARQARVAEPLGPVAPPRRSPPPAPTGRPAPIHRPPAPSTIRTVEDQGGRIKLGLNHLAPADLGHLQPEEDLGHLAPEEDLGNLVPQHRPKASAHKRPRRLTRAATSTQDALRHAIIMSEVLGPPLALRTPNNPLGGH